MLIITICLTLIIVLNIIYLYRYKNNDKLTNTIIQSFVKDSSNGIQIMIDISKRGKTNV